MTWRRRVFGLHAAEGAISQGSGHIRKAWVDADRVDLRLTRLRQALAAAGIPCEETSRRHLDELALRGNHQGVVLEIESPGERAEQDLYGALAAARLPALVLVLDQVQDPHNLGACLRTADAAGVMAVVLPKDRSVGLTPTVAKVASGAAESVPTYRVTNLARCLEKLQKIGLWVVGACGDAPSEFYDVDLTVPLALVLGAEGKGLRRLTRDKCDLLVNIPMMGQVESLNVSVAAAVLLYETVRQRTRHSSSGKG